MTAFRGTEHACPECGARYDVARRGQRERTPLADDEPPHAGDVSICFYCAALATFTGDGLEVRRATPAEVRAFVDDPAVERLLRLVRASIRARS